MTPFDDQYVGAAAGQCEGRCRTTHAGSNDDDVGRIVYAATIPRWTYAGQITPSARNAAMASAVSPRRCASTSSVC